jgi:hypothetical protein
MLGKLISAAAVVALATTVEAHGYISNPAPRALTIPGHRYAVEPQSDGAQGPGPGCNDGGRTGPIQVTWVEGQEVTVEVIVTANHRGFHELRFCDQATGGNGCLSETVATAVSHPSSAPGCPTAAPGGSSHGCLPGPPEQRSLFINDNPHTANYTFKLPENFTCSHCNMQWWWICNNYGGEFFKSCHDITIISSGPTGSPTVSPTPAPTPPTSAPTTVPTASPTPPTAAPTGTPTPPTTAPTFAPTPPPTTCGVAWAKCGDGLDVCCAGHTCMGSAFDLMCYATPGSDPSPPSPTPAPAPTPASGDPPAGPCVPDWQRCSEGDGCCNASMECRNYQGSMSCAP